MGAAWMPPLSLIGHVDLTIDLNDYGGRTGN